jgi:hypothetical protein
MVKRDLSSGLPREGTHHVEIAGIELRRSKAGDQMLKVKLKDADDGTFLCYDYWMLEGKGIWLGNQKLQAFGMDPKAEEFDEMDLMGRRGYAAFIVEQRDGFEPALKVDGRAEDSLAGYWPDDSPPLGFGASPVAPLDSQAPIDASDTPF